MRKMLLLLVSSLVLSACCHMGHHKKCDSCGSDKACAKGECTMDKKTDCCGDAKKEEKK